MVWKDIDLGKKGVEALDKKLQAEGFSISPFNKGSEVSYNGEELMIYDEGRVVPYFGIIEKLPQAITDKLRNAFRYLGLEEKVFGKIE